MAAPFPDVVLAPLVTGAILYNGMETRQVRARYTKLASVAFLAGAIVAVTAGHVRLAFWLGQLAAMLLVGSTVDALDTMFPTEKPDVGDLGIFAIFFMGPPLEYVLIALAFPLVYTIASAFSVSAALAVPSILTLLTTAVSVLKPKSKTE